MNKLAGLEVLECLFADCVHVLALSCPALYVKLFGQSNYANAQICMRGSYLFSPTVHIYYKL